MTIKVVSMLGILKRSFFLGMVDAGEITKASLFLNTLDELPLDMNDPLFFFTAMRHFNIFLRFGNIWI
jgi:hypothetical protein